MHVPLPLKLGLIALLIAGASGCTSEVPAEISSEPKAAMEGITSTITVLLDERTAAGVASIAEQYEADTGVAVQFRITEDLLADVQLASSTDVVDVIIAPHALQPDLLSGGFIQALGGDPKPDRYLTGAVAAFNLNGVQYGIPLSHENIALSCVAEAMPNSPTSFDEVVEAGLAVVMNDGAGDPYHLFPIQSSFGARVFQAGQNSSDTPQLAMSSPENLAFAAWLGANAELFDLASNTETAKKQLLSGDKSCWLTGPWHRLWFEENFGQDGWEVYPVPSVDLQPAAVFLEVIGAMVSSNSQSADAATEFVVDYLGGAPGQVSIFNSTGFPPSNLAALEMISDYKIPFQFGTAGLDGLPTPSNAEMDAVWYPWAQAQVEIIGGAEDPEAIWAKMVRQIQAAIG